MIYGHLGFQTHLIEGKEKVKAILSLSPESTAIFSNAKDPCIHSLWKKNTFTIIKIMLSFFHNIQKP